jgi:NADH-quinone oxidoreductase subunit G
VPAAGANGRGLLEAGFAPGYGPGLHAQASPGVGGSAGEGAPGDPARALGLHGIGTELAAGELTALYLLHADPLRSELARETWSAALERASTVIAHASFLTEGLREHATVVFPAESYAEKEGTIVHPDGRLQRLRPAIGRQGETRAEWSVIVELARRCDLELDVLTGPMASQQLFDAVPFYAELTLEEIGGRGVRWQERPAAAAFPEPPASNAAPADGQAPRADNGASQPGASHSIWDAPEVQFSPSLKFLYRGDEDEAQPVGAAGIGTVAPAGGER